MAIDGIRRFAVSVRSNPNAQAITLVFNFTKEDDGLRILLADLTHYTSAFLPVGNLPEEYSKFVLERYLAERRNRRLTTRMQFFDVSGKDDWDKLDYYQDVANDQEE